METFGSDEARSLDYCLEQVRSSDLFIGLYAERYGSLDSKTGRSITELEYRQAFAMSEEGSLLGLLVYVLDPKASWRVDLVDRDPDQVQKLAELKEELKARHTITYFNNVEDLSLDVLRDVLRKIGIGANVALKARAVFPQSAARPAQPLGMEHYTERDARWFRGREDDIAAICELVENNPEALLIGDSGIGKTSIIQAGVFPALRKKGWLPASCRPLDNPDESIPSAVWHQLMEGRPPSESIHTILSLVAHAHANRNVLVVIDQLEDVIPQLGTQRTFALLHALAQTYASPPAKLHLLLSYRGDAEPKVGSYWQAVSGSATGLPRHYLGTISREAAIDVVLDLVVPTGDSGATDVARLAAEIVSDTEAESTRSLGLQLYPPFLQMVVETIVKDAEEPKGATYGRLGRARQIIGRYLLNQLRLLGPRSKESKAVLISLAARGRRFRKTVEEIARDTDTLEAVVESCLADLAGLRLVHALDNKWEIVHDFLAQKVFEELIGPEEQEARVFRDVLAAKAAAFENTGEPLTYREHLGIYAHRQRMVPSLPEVELLFSSSMIGNGPAGYFLRSIPTELPIAWAEGHMRSSEPSNRENACRFLLATGRNLSLAILADVFADYKLQGELSDFIRRFSNEGDVDILMKLRRKKAELTRQAATERLEQMIGPSDTAIIKKLAGSKQSHDIGLLCRVVIAKTDPGSVSRFRDELNRGALYQRLIVISALGAFGEESDAQHLLERLVNGERSAKERQATGHALAYRAQARRQRRSLRNLLEHRDVEVARGALGALRDRLGISITCLIQQYSRLPFETSRALLQTAQPRDCSALRAFVSRTFLQPELRDAIIALLRVGDRTTARWLLDLIGSRDYSIRFWNAPVLAAALSQAVDIDAKRWLSKLTESEEFWHYTWEKRSPNPLPVELQENLYLFKRLVGVALAGLCDAGDWPLLKRLVFHEYWQIQVAAAARVKEFADVSRLGEIIEEARKRAKDKPNAGVVHTLIALDGKLFPPA